MLSFRRSAPPAIETAAADPAPAGDAATTPPGRLLRRDGEAFLRDVGADLVVGPFLAQGRSATGSTGPGARARRAGRWRSS